jgi:DHA2 family multidrug resistance protein-like MFS transporter
MPRSQAGVASAVTNTSRQVGGALGVAVLGAVGAARFTAVLPGRLAGLRLPAPVRERIQAAAGQAVGTAPQGAAGAPAVRHAVGSAFVAGIHASYLLAGLALVCGALVALARLRPAREAAAPPTADAVPGGVGRGL